MLNRIGNKKAAICGVWFKLLQAKEKYYAYIVSDRH